MSKNHYSLLLGTLVLELVVLSIEIPSPWLQLSIVALVAAIALLLFSIGGRLRDVWILLLLHGVAYGLDWTLPWGAGHVIVDGVKVVFWTAAPAYLAWRVFAEVFAAEIIGRDEIAGAVAVYLLLAHVFANVYEAMLLLNPGAFEFAAHFPPDEIGFGEMIYFSVVTLSTLGYGDISPSTPPMAESMVGVLYLAIMIAHFMSLRATPSSRAPRD